MQSILYAAFSVIFRIIKPLIAISDAIFLFEHDRCTPSNDPRMGAAHASAAFGANWAV